MNKEGIILFKIINSFTPKIIVLMDRYKQPSTQIKEISLTNNLDGLYVFDTGLVKGLKSTRFVTTNVQNGIVDPTQFQYKNYNINEINRINSIIKHSVPHLSDYLLKKEIETIDKELLITK